MKKLLLPVIAMLLISFAQDNFKPLTQLAGGTWKMKTAKGYICESWKKTGTKALTGKGFRIAGKDTTVEENTVITMKDGGLVYIATVAGQNEGKSIPFKLLSVHNGIYQFNNPTHDYPQTVGYQLVGKDSLNAWIDGINKGAKKRIDFHYKREM